MYGSQLVSNAFDRIQIGLCSWVFVCERGFRRTHLISEWDVIQLPFNCFRYRAPSLPNEPQQTFESSFWFLTVCLSTGSCRRPKNWTSENPFTVLRIRPFHIYIFLFRDVVGRPTFPDWASPGTELRRRPRRGTVAGPRPRVQCQGQGGGCNRREGVATAGERRRVGNRGKSRPSCAHGADKLIGFPVCHFEEIWSDKAGFYRKKGFMKQELRINFSFSMDH